MLKDITLGQYFPGTSPVHRLDPRLKIVLVTAYIAALFLVKGAAAYVLMALFNVAVIAIARLNPKLILRGLKPMVFIVALTSVMHMLYSPGERELFSFWVFRVTVEGVYTAAFMVTRILLLVSVTFLMTYTTSPIMLTDAIERLMGPLKVIRVPVHELAMMMTIALRFIPTLIEETDKIMSAQKARGADFESGGLFRRAKALIPLLVPLFVSAFRRADELAMAMEARCYHGGQGRTRMKQLRLTRLDALAGLLCALWLAGAVSLRVFL